MSDKKIHIVAFDVPYPPDYGGAMDVYYRIKALHLLGYKIHLHCYEYGRGEQKALENITDKVYYYKRRKTLFDWFNTKPFIVQTRRSNRLLQELTKDRSPILFEGLHTTYFLKDDRLKNQLKLVRTHNIEHEYYYHLALNSTGWKKRYFLSETKKLQKYEPILHHADHILAIKDSDKKYFSQYGKTSVLYPCSEVKNGEKKPTKPYAIFHGNLSVSENERAVKWLIEHIDSTIDLIIAGKNPSSNLKSIIKKKKIRLFENPDKQQMDELIQNARIHLLYTDQSTGVKLKLINALQCSGHILVNDKMVEGTRFDQLCTVLSRKEEWNKKIHELIEKELTTEEFNRRTQFIKNHLICTKSCSIIKNIIQNNL